MKGAFQAAAELVTGSSLEVVNLLRWMLQVASALHAHLLISTFQHESACYNGILLVTGMSMPAKLGTRPKLIYMTTVAKFLEPAQHSSI